MAATSDAGVLVGRTFDCAFTGFVPRFTFHSADMMRVEAMIGDTRIDETVTVEVTAIRPNLFIMNWTEKNGNFVVQVQDHDSKIVHNYARLADGSLFCGQGDIRAVAEASTSPDV
jgi:hypothetical protein